MTRLGPRFSDALVFAADVHAGQLRKGADEIPYIAHLLAVASIVIENGGSEDEAIAALLHDAVEDRGGEPRAQEIEERFGAPVAGIVRECSDSIAADPAKKDDWRERKRAYLDHLRTASDGAIAVSLADKVHNARAIVRDVELHGDGVWERFSETDPVKQVRYYHLLARRLRDRAGDSPLVEELEQAVGDMRVRAGVSMRDAEADL